MDEKILIVDDERLILELLHKTLLSKVYRVDVHDTPEEALEAIRTTVYDVVITDLKFSSGLTGMDVLRAARERCPETSVIVMTGYGTIKNAVEAMQTGAADYLTKPFDLTEMGVKVERLLEMKRMAANLEEKHESLTAIERSSQRNIGALEWDAEKTAARLENVRRQVRSLLEKMPDADPWRSFVAAIERELGQLHG